MDTKMLKQMVDAKKLVIDGFATVRLREKMICLAVHSGDTFAAYVMSEKDALEMANALLKKLHSPTKVID